MRYYQIWSKGDAMAVLVAGEIRHPEAEPLSHSEAALLDALPRYLDPVGKVVSFFDDDVRVRSYAADSKGDFRLIETPFPEPPALGYAVEDGEMLKYGCPSCGYRSGSMRLSMGGAGSWTCGSCRENCLILAPNVDVSPIGLCRPGSEEVFYPTKTPHPRSGVPSHGQKDASPPGGGEYFRSRGVGLDFGVSCFVCGAQRRAEDVNDAMNNIAAFVRCKAAGERVVALFRGGSARLDYRDFEPDRVQVKVGACDAHVGNLGRLHALSADGIITADRVGQARA